MTLQPSQLANGANWRHHSNRSNHWCLPPSQASKPQLRRWIDTVGEVYSKVVIAATFAALVGLPMCGVPMLRYRRPC